VEDEVTHVVDRVMRGKVYDTEAAPEMVSCVTLDRHRFYEKGEHENWPNKADYSSDPAGAANKLLREAVRRSDFPTVELAVTLGADPLLKSTYGFTILHEAIVVTRSEAFVEHLIENWPQLVNECSSQGSTPLMKAVELGWTAVIGHLLLAGANLNSQDFYGRSALMRGAMSNFEMSAFLLVPLGADKHLVDVNGLRAVDLALTSGNARAATDLGGSFMAAVVPGYVGS